MMFKLVLDSTDIMRIKKVCCYNTLFLHNIQYVNYNLFKAFLCSSLTMWVYKSVT